MAREYGSRRSSRRTSSASHHLLVITVTFLLCYLTASFLDVETVGRWMNKQILESHEQLNQASSKSTPVKKEQSSPKPKFEFYTLLANEKKGAPAVPASNSRPVATQVTAAAASVKSAQTTSSTAVTSATIATTNKSNLPVSRQQQIAAVRVGNAKPLTAKPAVKGNFVVQVASFKARNDAEHMKGLLILKGFEVSVVPISTPAKGNWFRVVIGPYPNRNLAQKAQVILSKNERLNGMVLSSGG